MGLFNLLKPAKTVLVVDIVALNESLGMKGNVAPRNQLQSLRRLSRFAQREKISVVAVICGTVLNKAPDGKKFEGITIHYSKSAEDHPKTLVKITRSNGSGAILVTGNADAEKMLGSNGGKLRVSTFRKAFDTVGDQEQSGRGSDRNSGGNRGNRSPRKSRQKQSSNEPRAERQPKKEASPTDAISELIDLVD